MGRSEGVDLGQRLLYVRILVGRLNLGIADEETNMWMVDWNTEDAPTEIDTKFQTHQNYLADTPCSLVEPHPNSHHGSLLDERMDNVSESMYCRNSRQSTFRHSLHSAIPSQYVVLRGHFYLRPPTSSVLSHLGPQRIEDIDLGLHRTKQ